MKFISYAQNFEDVMLLRALGGVVGGFYVDVGAQDPIRDSVSKTFYEMGWSGINIEPVPFWFEKLCADRPRDLNLRVAASSSEEEMTLYEVKDSGLSTMDIDHAESYRREGMEIVKHSVQSRTLTSILAEARVQEIHFLKIDVEGAEKDVLEGMDFGRFRPWVIVIEARLPNSTAEAFQTWEQLIVSAGYAFAWDDGLNRFYRASEHVELAQAFRYPPNVFDEFVRYSEFQLDEALRRVQTSEATVISDRDQLKQWAQELEARLADAQLSMASQQDLGEKLELQHREMVSLDEALQQARANEAAINADHDELEQWARGLEARLADAQLFMASQQDLGEKLELQHREMVSLDEALQQARANEAAINADRDELEQWARGLEARLADAQLFMASQQDLGEKLNLEHQERVKLEEAFHQSRTSESATIADRDQLKQWARELECRLADAEGSLSASADLLANREVDIRGLQDSLLKTNARYELLEQHDLGLATRLEKTRFLLHKRGGSLSRLIREFVEFRRSHVILQGQWADLRSLHEANEVDNGRLRKVTQTLTDEIHQIREEFALMEQELSATRQLVASKNIEIEQIHQSRSWAITAPLRQFSNLLRAFRHRRGFGKLAVHDSDSLPGRAGGGRTGGEHSSERGAVSIEETLLGKDIEALNGLRRKIRRRRVDGK